MIEFLSGNKTEFDKLKKQWAKECIEYGELFDDYAIGVLSVVESLVDEPEDSVELIGIKSGEKYSAFLQLNTASIPGYDSPVLRARHLTFSPKFDFGELSLDEYADLLIGVLASVIAVSNTHPDLSAKHIKFHLKSPNDRNFFRTLGVGLNEIDTYDVVKVVGSWLYITKSELSE